MGIHNTNTWVDGVGRWHASVPLSGSARKDAMAARKLILTEMGRQGIGRPTLRIKREQVTNHGTVKYTEV